MFVEEELPILKLLFFISVILFLGVGVIALSKKEKKAVQALSQEKVPVKVEAHVPDASVPSAPVKGNSCRTLETDLPNIDRVSQLFSTNSSKFPIVETIEYTSSPSWLKGRPAWLADYAVYYGTSKHFIARSLHGKPDYYSQQVSTGNRFNVFKKDKKIEFHLVVDVSRLKLGFYYVDLETHDRVLIKTYRVCLGRVDPTKPSGTLTPLGTYQLGEKVSQYKPGMMGFFHDRKVEMVQMFGSRWIPFETEIANCTEPAKGYGLNGAPWIVDSKTGMLIENRDCIGKYESDGCIRLLSEDIEELYAIIITKPTFIHVGKEFHDIALPGVEVAAPVR
jgi:lipoprotein-anchoring transpeptidase ErfK/SrfK